MATLIPGVFLKLLESMNTSSSSSKPSDESFILQVIHIVPAPSEPTHGFYLKLSDSIKSTHVSPSSNEDADLHRPQPGHLVRVDRLQIDLSFPRAVGLLPISSPSGKRHPLIGLPEPLIVVSAPFQSTGFVIQRASALSAAATIKPRKALAPIDNSSTNKQRKNPSPAKGSRAPLLVLSKFKVPSLVALREENSRKVRRESSGYVVASRYRQQAAFDGGGS